MITDHGRARATLDRLADLKANWDSYGAPALSSAALKVARTMLDAPQVVPTPGGGIQLEWHQDGLDIEIVIPAGVANDTSFVPETE